MASDQVAAYTTIMEKATRDEAFRKEIIHLTNWRRLQQQKMTLLKVADEALEEDGNDLSGLVSFLDALQDFVVDTYGLSKSEVFNDQVQED